MKPSASATSKQPPYEDLISAFGPIRKPGYISPRSKEEQRRKAFVSDLISALQDASDARAARDEKTCARDAYSQLQYDFPDVDAADLAALNKQVCKALQENKALRFVPSTKMIANITTAAKQQGRGGVTMQYQHLTATYCIRYVHHVLTLNNTLAARHLQRMATTTSDTQASTHPDPPHPNPPPHGILAHAAGVAPTPHAPPPALPLPNTYAAEQDEDTMVYEDMMCAHECVRDDEEDDNTQIHAYTHHHHQQQQHAAAQVGGEHDTQGGVGVNGGAHVVVVNGNSKGDTHAGNAQEECVSGMSVGGWEACLVGLGTAADVECIQEEDVWQQGNLLESVITTTAAATNHPAAETLHPLITTLCTVAAARIAQHSSGGVGYMRDMWSALGVPHEGVVGGWVDGQAVAHMTELREVSVCRMVSLMGFTAHVTALTKEPQVKAAIVKQLHESYVPVMAVALECVAKIKGGIKGGEIKGGLGEAPLQLQLLQSTCEVLQFYQLHVANKTTAAAKLVSTGTLRTLSQLFTAHALAHDMEALRRCMLFAAAASQEACTWISQVPNIPTIVLGEVFTQHELVEAHGIAWAALLGETSSRGGLGGVVANALEGDGASDPVKLAHARRVLSLGVDVAHAAGPQVMLWSTEDVRQLTQVAQHVRRVQEAAEGVDEQGRGGEKQRHLQGVCLRLIRDISAGKEKRGCKAE